MADYAAIAAAIEQDEQRRASQQRGDAMVLQQRRAQELEARRVALADQYNVQQRTQDLARADHLASVGRYAEAGALQSKYATPASSGVTMTSANNADRYVPSAQAVASSSGSSSRSSSRSGSGGGTTRRASGSTGDTNTPAQTASTGDTNTPAQTVSTATVAPAPTAVQQPIAYTPQVGSGGVQLVRQPTPCELGQGGCQSPHEVSSHVAQWELDGNRPLSIRQAAFLYPLMQQASNAERSAAQAGAANLYDRALGDPNLQSNIQSLQSQGVPYGLALAQARKDATDSGYARMLMGMPQVIAAQDAVSSVDQAAAGAAGAPYVDRFGQITGYYPQVTKFDPTAGTLTVNNANYTGTGLSGVDVPLAVDTISGGLPRYAATARSGISAVTNQTNKLKADAAKDGTNLAVEQAKADIRSNEAVQRIEAQQKSDKELALYNAGIKSGTIKPPAPPPLVQVN